MLPACRCDRPIASWLHGTRLPTPFRSVIEAAASKLRGTAAEGAVSKADLVALAGAYAVRITGGPAIQVGSRRGEDGCRGQRRRCGPDMLA